MSDTSIPMPKVIGEPPPHVARDNGIPDTPRSYAPKRALEAVADALAPPPPLGQGGGTGYKDGGYKPAGHAGVIKEKLKALTHREMRDLVAEIFAAHKKVGGLDTNATAITVTEMPDVLDRLAYGD